MDPTHCTIDLWPDVREYEKTYATEFKLEDGYPAKVFSSWDSSTVDVHFRWMKDYGIDGVFMQRFFDVTRDESSRCRGNFILRHALKSSQEHGRVIAVMYDLSGLRPGEDCSSVSQDWKELVDELKITDRGSDQTYLYLRDKPLVAIWGLGFPDRPYNIREIGFDKLLDFLKNDSEYGGCSVMLGVPTYFRELKADTVPDSYLHTLIEQADVVMPWMVQRFTSSLQNEFDRYRSHVESDISWCESRGIDYAPCVYVPARKLGAELLFDIIGAAYERQSLIVTTNLPFENWTEVLDSERLTGAALDRLTHRCQIIETKGESYRLKDARRRRRKK